MASPNSRPDTINALKYGVDAAFAMLVGMQLENSSLSPPVPWVRIGIITPDSTPSIQNETLLQR